MLNKYVEILTRENVDIAWDILFTDPKTGREHSMDWGRIGEEMLGSNIARFTSRAVAEAFTGYGRNAIAELTKRAVAQTAVKDAFAGNIVKNQLIAHENPGLLDWSIDGKNLTKYPDNWAGDLDFKFDNAFKFEEIAPAEIEITGLSEIPFAGFIGSPLFGASLSYYSMANAGGATYYNEINSQPFIEKMTAKNVFYKGLSPEILRWNIDQTTDNLFLPYRLFLEQNEVISANDQLWDVLGVSNENILILWDGKEFPTQFEYDEGAFSSTNIASRLQVKPYPEQYEPVRMLGANNWFFVRRKIGELFLLQAIDITMTKPIELQVLARKNGIDRIREHLAFDHVYWELFQKEMHEIMHQEKGWFSIPEWND